MIAPKKTKSSLCCAQFSIEFSYAFAPQNGCLYFVGTPASGVTLAQIAGERAMHRTILRRCTCQPEKCSLAFSALAQNAAVLPYTSSCAKADINAFSSSAHRIIKRLYRLRHGFIERGRGQRNLHSQRWARFSLTIMPFCLFMPNILKHGV